MCVQYLGAAQKCCEASNAGEEISSGRSAGSRTRENIKIDETPIIILRTEVLERRGTKVYCLMIDGFSGNTYDINKILLDFNCIEYQDYVIQ
jgi:hypothetical protein